MKTFIMYFIFLFAFASLTAQQKREIFFADPTIYVSGGKYYLTGTSGDRGVRGFSILTSTDLKTWSVPPEAGDTIHAILSRGDHAYGDSGFWAPQLFRTEKQHYLAYTANEQTALAQSTSLLGPYTQELVRPIDPTAKNIDPFIFRDDDGKYYMYHVRFDHGNYLWVAEFDLGNGKIKPGTLTKCFGASEPWETTPDYPSDPIMEGPTVLKLDGKYYLFYSANHYQSKDYAVGYAVSHSPYGPWEKQKNNPIIHRSVVSENGSGHGDLFTGLDGQLYYVYHVHFSSERANPRRTRIVPVKKQWDEKAQVYRFNADGDHVIVPLQVP